MKSLKTNILSLKDEAIIFESAETQLVEVNSIAYGAILQFDPKTVQSRITFGGVIPAFGLGQAPVLFRLWNLKNGR